MSYIKKISFLFLISLTSLANGSMLKLDPGQPVLTKGKMGDCQKRYFQEFFNYARTLNSDSEHDVSKSELSDFDKLFLKKNLLNLNLLSIVRLSKPVLLNFIQLTCTERGKDHSISNALSHFFWSIFLGTELSKEKSCRFTTGHEFRLVQSNGNLELKNLNKSNYMDLINNNVGLQFLEREPELSRNCVDEVLYLTQLRNNSYQQNSNVYDDVLYEVLEEELKKYFGDKSEIVGACRKIVDKLFQENEYNLVYFDDTQNCDLKHGTFHDLRQ